MPLVSVTGAGEGSFADCCQSWIGGFGWQLGAVAGKAP